ncbi:chloride channel protein [Dactylosporangium matsuzakiense]|uniref:chloride channel protein n=1 Tax=Dactylosporangium matsuzakiense TaxID=53360 RepID=UPI0022F2D05A|nr:chloride channel protein [Dactylosporangium matsuzakiense]
MFWDRLRGGSAGLLALAVAIGAGASLGAVGFRWLVVAATELFSGWSDYTAHVGAAHRLLPWAGRWFVVAAPVAAGLLYGPLIQLGAREARGHGVPEVMYAVTVHGGRIRPRVAMVKSLASALCIGGGGSVGREGPIVQVGSALASAAGQLLRLPDSRLRLLVAAGAAGAVSATFNAPIAAVFFALELILADFAVESFAAVVLASVTSSAISRALLGDHPFLALPTFHVVSPVEYLWYGALGLLAAVVGVGFSRMLYLIEDACDRCWRGPEWLRPAVGGLLLGGVLLALPELYGVGYPVLDRAVAGNYSVVFLLVLLIGKMLAASLTIGIGGSGGVFGPTLFIGAMLGAAVGDAAHSVMPGLAAPPGAYALVGMGAVFAGAARTPITAVVMIFELTGEYSVVLPLMVAVALAAGASRLLSADTIYTRKLHRRGIDLGRDHRPAPTVDTVARALPAALPAQASLDEVAQRFAAGGHDALPVVDDHGRLRGVVPAVEVERALRDHASDVTAADLASGVPVLRAGQSLDEALDAVVRAGGLGVPVQREDTLVGWITHRDILAAVTRDRRPGRTDGQ